MDEKWESRTSCRDLIRSLLSPIVRVLPVVVACWTLIASAAPDPKLKEMVLVKNSRLSVQPVTAEEFKYICKLGGVKA